MMIFKLMTKKKVLNDDGMTIMMIALAEQYGIYTAVNGNIRAVYVTVFHCKSGQWFTDRV